MSNAYTNERNLLKFSSFSCFCFAAMGIGVGIWTSSMVIVFDGAYSLLGLILSLIALLASHYIQKLSLEKNQDGSEIYNKKVVIIESLVVLIKGIAVAMICILSFISAIEAMFTGGRQTETDFALLFGIINVIGCLYTYRLLNKKSGVCPSVILQAESNQWLVDTVISAAVLVGFILTTILLMAGFTEFAGYADPLMLIVASIYFVSLPIEMINKSARKLLVIYQGAH